MTFTKVRARGVREGSGWFIALGIGLMVAGALAILLPLWASLATTVVLGWLLAISGLMTFVHALANRRWTHSGWAIVAGLIEVLAGLLLALRPIAGTLSLTLILAAYFVAEGVLRVLRASQHRALPGWGWLLFDGVVSLALGAMILVGWPATAVWALGLLLGIELVLGGSSMLVIGLGAGAPAGARV